MAPIPGAAMAPACILLDRDVPFRSHPQETEPFNLDSGERVKRAALKPPTTMVPESREATEEAIAECLVTMTPDLKAVEPPEVSRLTMQRPNYGWAMRDGAVAAAADKNLVVLNAGSGLPSYTFHRWYLILDLDADASSSSSLSAIPGIRFEYTESYRSAGYGTIIMTRQRGGAFVLADLFFDLPNRGALLCLWESSLCSWIYKRGQLPAEVPHDWRINMAFPVQSRNRNLFCWVDLLHGLLLWDLSEIDILGDLLNVSFVPLPHGGYISDRQPRWSSPQEFCNAACVDGTIKFLKVDGFMEGSPISLDTYALNLDNPSHPSWMADTKMLLKDLWADKTFISDSEHVPRIMFPILSTVEHDVVYLTIPGDVERVEGYRFRGVKLVLSVDMHKTRVISGTKPKDPRALVRWRYLFAASVSHSQWGSKYHQGAEEAIGMAASGKRMKFE